MERFNQSLLEAEGAGVAGGGKPGKGEGGAGAG